MAHPCYICGAPISELEIDPRDGKTLPCHTCLDAVDDILDYWNEDKVYAYLEDNEDKIID